MIKSMETLTVGMAIVGLINGIQKQFPQVTGMYAWGLAVVLGAVSAYIPMDHPAVVGALAALAGSGLYKVGQVVGGK
mgnify:CR=1 FL=1